MVWKWLKSPVVMGVAVGVVSHQVLDLMWREPQNWLYPFYGPFHGDLNAEFFSVLAIRELTNPFEILVALLLFVGVLLVVYRDDILKIFARHTTVWKWLMIAAAIVLCGLSVVCGSIGFLMGEGIRKQTKLLHDWFGWTGWSRPEEFIIGGVIFLLAGYLFWRWRLKVRRTAG